MKAFCMDVHISIIEDFKVIFPEIQVTNWCLSGHAWALKRNQDVPAHVNAMTWRSLSPQSIDAFRRQYDGFLRTFDVFIVGYASCFAMIYEPYNKPVLMLNAVRYDVPFCWTHDMRMLDSFKQCLHRIHQRGKLTIVSNNRPDHLYTLKGLGIQSQILPSLCQYAGIRYAPTRPEFLLYTSWKHEHPLLAKRPARFEWSDIGTYRGIVHIPYEATATMSMFEQFTSGIPLFLPSMRLWKELTEIQSVSAYWGGSTPRDLVEFASTDYWRSISDIHEMLASPNTHIFDSVEELDRMLETFVYVPEDKTPYIEGVKTAWRKVISNLQTRA